MPTMFGTELLPAYELPFSASYPSLTPLHLFFVLNVLIIVIILISQYSDKGNSHAMREVRASQRAQSLLLSVGSFSYYHEASPCAEKEMQRFTKLRAVDNELLNNEYSPVAEKAQYLYQMPIIDEPELEIDGFHQQRRESEEIPPHRQKLKEEKKKDEDDEEEEAGAAASFDGKMCAEKQLCSLEQERPLASTHFPHRKVVSRVHTCNSPLKISRASATRKGDTLDATWKAICDEKSRHSSPLRHHRLLATRIRKAEATCKTKELSISPLKQKEQMRCSSPTFTMRRRERSMTRDELHARVESFISKFNQQIKLQRQQSLLGYEN